VKQRTSGSAAELKKRSGEASPKHIHKDSFPIRYADFRIYFLLNVNYYYFYNSHIDGLSNGKVTSLPRTHIMHIMRMLIHSVLAFTS